MVKIVLKLDNYFPTPFILCLKMTIVPNVNLSILLSSFVDFFKFPQLLFAKLPFAVIKCVTLINLYTLKIM